MMILQPLTALVS